MSAFITSRIVPDTWRRHVLCFN